MSHLLVVVRPSIVAGFRLAGVEAFAAENAAQAETLIDQWMAQGESGLLAIDDGLLAALDPGFRRRLEACEALPHMSLPSGEPAGPELSSQRQIADLIRRVVGFHVTFRGARREAG